MVTTYSVQRGPPALGSWPLLGTGVKVKTRCPPRTTGVHLGVYSSLKLLFSTWTCILAYAADGG